MKRLKICITGMLLLISIATFSQTKKHRLPPPPPPPPEIKAEKPAEPQKITDTELSVPPTPAEAPAPSLPPPPELKYGHPWTRNGKNVFVAKPPKPAKPKPAIPPPPPPQPIKD